MPTETYHILIFYVPERQAEEVKDAVFSAGAGKLGTYDQCCWQVRGKGQFRPLEGSQPYVGNIHVIEHVDEIRVELICHASRIKAAVNALITAHPYETPAYAHWQINQ